MLGRPPLSFIATSLWADGGLLGALLFNLIAVLAALLFAALRSSAPRRGLLRAAAACGELEGTPRSGEADPLLPAAAAAAAARSVEGTPSGVVDVPPATLWNVIAFPEAAVGSFGRGAHRAVASLVLTRHFLLGTLLLAVVDGALLLPVLVTGSVHAPGFRRSTAANVAAGSWRHFVVLAAVLLSLLLVHVGAARFARVLAAALARSPPVARRVGRSTLMVRGLPLRLALREAEDAMDAYVRAWLSEQDEDEEDEEDEDDDVEDGKRNVLVVAAPDVSERVRLRSELERARQLLEDMREEPAAYRPSSWRFWHRVDGVAYFAQRVRELETQVDKAEAVPPRFTGYVFVTLPTTDAAFQFYLAHASKEQRRDVSASREAADLGVARWKVRPACEPDDILRDRAPAGRVRWLLLNTIVVSILLFFTTPVAILSGVRSASALPGVGATVRDFEAWAGYGGHLLFSLLPPLLILVVSSVMPDVLFRVTDLENHPTESAVVNRSLSRVFIFLALNIVVMPALVLSSFDLLIALAVAEGSLLDILGAMFTVHTSSYIVIYILNTAVAGNLWDLCMPSVIFFAKINAKLAATATEAREANAVPPFNYSGELATQVALFMATLTFSATSPLVLLAGVIYFVFKYYTDKYQFMYVDKHTQPHDMRAFQMAHARTLFTAAFFALSMAGFFFLNAAWTAGAVAAVAGCLSAVHTHMRFRKRRLIADDFHILLASRLPDDEPWRVRAAKYRTALQQTK